MLQKIPLFLFFTFAISSHAETKSPVPAHPLRINELLKELQLRDDGTGDIVVCGLQQVAQSMYDH